MSESDMADVLGFEFLPTIYLRRFLGRLASEYGIFICTSNSGTPLGQAFGWCSFYGQHHPHAWVIFPI
ncbi:MAG: hypothetical protein OSA88_11015 [Acidimicrobiales bacterium]|nr:hypothetical protein [Acidimicrobiales bacterium]